MKNRGGIFDAPTALGALGAMQSCTADNSTLIRKIQTYLKGHGAPLLKVDGSWQGCTASAFKKVFGSPFVYNDNIVTMTGEPCSQDDVTFGGLVLGLSIPSANLCTDGSDGVSVGSGGSGGTPEQQCSAGSCWNTILRACVLDPTGFTCQQTPNTGGSGTTVQQTSCPQGQTWNDFLKTCLPDFTQMIGGGGGSGGSTGLPIGSDPTECASASGMMKNPLTGKCTGSGGIEQPPTECASGMQKIMGKCFPGLTGGGGAAGGGCPQGQIGIPPICFPSGGDSTTKQGGCPEGSVGISPFCFPQPTQPQGGACPAGQVNVPLLGCVTNPFGGGGGAQPQGGDLFSQIGAAIQSMLSSLGVPGVTPVTPPVTPTVPESPFGNWVYIIGGILGVGVLAVGGYALAKGKKGRRPSRSWSGCYQRATEEDDWQWQWGSAKGGGEHYCYVLPADWERTGKGWQPVNEHARANRRRSRRRRSRRYYRRGRR